MRSSSKRHIINEAIKVDQVRLVETDGKQVGVVTIAEARAAAADAGLDLVLISPDADPPVCKIMDHGKHVFELKKQRAANKKRQHRVHLKEVKFRPGTDQADYEVKMRNLVRFLEEGNKVKVSLRFRGREITHPHIGREMMERIRLDTAEQGTVEQHPKMEGRLLIMVLAPVKNRQPGR